MTRDKRLRMIKRIIVISVDAIAKLQRKMGKKFKITLNRSMNYGIIYFTFIPSPKKTQQNILDWNIGYQRN